MRPFKVKNESKFATLPTKLTLFGLNLIGDGVSADGQRGREENIAGGSWLVGVGEAGLSAPAAQRLIGEGALQWSSRRLKEKNRYDHQSQTVDVRLG